MPAYKTETFMRTKYYTWFQETSLTWIPRSRSVAPESRSRWAASTCIGILWEYPPLPPPSGGYGKIFKNLKILVKSILRLCYVVSFLASLNLKFLIFKCLQNTPIWIYFNQNVLKRSFNDINRRKHLAACNHFSDSYFYFYPNDAVNQNLLQNLLQLLKHLQILITKSRFCNILAH